jgi:hypothetical protein
MYLWWPSSSVATTARAWKMFGPLLPGRWWALPCLISSECRGRRLVTHSPKAQGRRQSGRHSETGRDCHDPLAPTETKMTMPPGAHDYSRNSWESTSPVEGEERAGQSARVLQSDRTRCPSANRTGQAIGERDHSRCWAMRYIALYNRCHRSSRCGSGSRAASEYPRQNSSVSFGASRHLGRARGE